ncbi:uncharacterized protein LOC126673690 [Mercurialis annua]|uniref:uncharacterized protein LOC126673690 n=1 Tax=Mercurialis annua TaxID=3986 RepID=UPI00215DD867|nr:uncharacterized protein LOC126673690 [Mercurialis annua]XP_050223880.1 uncharacterized protein LOC126673690 [Mercurialis annua]
MRKEWLSYVNGPKSLFRVRVDSYKCIFGRIADLKEGRGDSEEVNARRTQSGTTVSGLKRKASETISTPSSRLKTAQSVGCPPTYEIQDVESVLSDYLKIREQQKDKKYACAAATFGCKPHCVAGYPMQAEVESRITYVDMCIELSGLVAYT